MNISKLNELFENSKLSKVEFAKRCDITRATLDNALQGGDIRVSILEKIASVLQIPVGTLFEDSSPSVSLSGDHNQVNGHGASGNINGASAEMAALKERNDSLERIIESKDAIIDTLRHQSETYERTIKYFTEKK